MSTETEIVRAQATVWLHVDSTNIHHCLNIQVHRDSDGVSKSLN